MTGSETDDTVRITADDAVSTAILALTVANLLDNNPGLENVFDTIASGLSDHSIQAAVSELIVKE